MSNPEIGGSEASAAGMGVSDYARVARTYWKHITVITLIVTVLATAWSAFRPRVFAAEATAIVLAVGTDNVSSLLAGDTLAKAKAKTYKSLAESRLVADKVSASTGVNMTGESLLGAVTVTVPRDTAEMRIKAESPNPTTAQRVADAWIVELARQVEERERAAAAAGQPAAPAGQPAPVVTPPISLVPLDPATVPTHPVSPGMGLTALYGAAVGLLLAYASALLRDRLDRRLRTAAEVENLFSVPVVGTLPVDLRLTGENKVLGGLPAAPAPGSRPQSPAFSEALRELRTNLTFLDVDNPPRIIVVTSSVSGEGKSTIAANLASAMAAAGDPVIVVDGDLRHPSVAKIFDVVPGIGITDVLTGKAEVDDVLQQRGDLPNLSILGAGRTPPNPSELLSSHAMKQLLNSLAERGIVIIDAPPLLPVTDAVLLAKIADGAIVVVRAGQTTKEQLTKSLGNIRKVNATILGTLLNCVPAKEFEGYSYYSPEPDSLDSTSSPEKAAARDKTASPDKAARPQPANSRETRSPVSEVGRDKFSKSSTSF
ncbi:polysaccharide biosynthesis tyrosine autokinase [Pseudarthrobacter sp. NamB4]|uniref:polysaccharide biosynthesis tyrosine autokinase n=1 Tax=Pseudarthrobacter sp. NamB4 TaxID=2576837 RepID=UPI0014854194|nr:polysaccharide biosynthesis tyrosine autokinase [Pseudarthrobacter sp. NamB4]